MNSLGMTPLVPIFRANLPEEWILFLDIHLDRDTAHDLLSNVECRNCPGDDKPQGQSCGVYPRAFPSGRETRRKKLDTEQSVGTPSSSLEVAIPRANRPISDVWMPQESLRTEDLRIQIKVLIAGRRPQGRTHPEDGAPNIF